MFFEASNAVVNNPTVTFAHQANVSVAARPARDPIAHPCPDRSPINSLPTRCSALPELPASSKVFQPTCIFQIFIIRGIVQFVFLCVILSD